MTFNQNFEIKTLKKGICKPTKFKLRFDGHPIIAYVLLCEDQVECTACGISQMNQTRIETSNQKATMRSERRPLRKIEYLWY